MGDMIEAVVSKRPQKTICIIIAPWLTSEKRTFRKELRRIEDKLEAKGLHAEQCMLRMEKPPEKKAVPSNFIFYVCLHQNSMDDNPFAKCQLILDRQALTVPY